MTNAPHTQASASSVEHVTDHELILQIMERAYLSDASLQVTQGSDSTLEGPATGWREVTRLSMPGEGEPLTHHALRWQRALTALHASHNELVTVLRHDVK